MPRRRTHIPITVLFNGRIVGRLLKTAAGALSFQYQPEWLSQPDAIPVSLSLPLREDPFRGPEVGAVFENLLPDSEALRRGIAEKVGARGTDAYSLLSEIGRDCVGALQFLPEDGEYQSQGGPGMVEVLELLKGSDTPAEDFKRFLKAQVLFWLIGATDGHAKNFSVFLGAGGRFRMTPLYDVLTAQPSLRERQVERKQMRLAMSVGDSRHYRMDEIAGRHFVQTAQKARIATALAREVLDEVAGAADAALDAIKKQLPPGFPEKIHVSVKAAIQERLKRIAPRSRSSDQVAIGR
jgi:HipA-like protein